MRIEPFGVAVEESSEVVARTALDKHVCLAGLDSDCRQVVVDKARVRWEAQRFTECRRCACEIAALFQGEPEVAVAGCVVRVEGNRASERTHSIASPTEMQKRQTQILMSPRVIRTDPDQPHPQLDRPSVVAGGLVHQRELPQRDRMVRIKLKNLLV